MHFYSEILSYSLNVIKSLKIQKGQKITWVLEARSNMQHYKGDI